MGYFLYTRKSEEDEGRQIQSIGDQLKIGKQLAEDTGLYISDIFEEARSAKRPGRPIFNAMIARVEAGEADGIIAWHPDRLSRNAIDAGVIIDLIDRGKLRDLKFQSYRFENTPEGKWMLNIVLGQSKYYVDKLSKDVTRGIQSKLEKGHFPHLAPVGYINEQTERTIQPDPERFELIKRAFHLVLTGAYSVPEALEVLNHQWGFRTRKTARTGGTPLSRSAFYSMLINPFYTGMMEHSGQLYEGKHPPMLSQQEFQTIQHKLRRVNSVQRQKQEFDFTGLIRCGLCGCRITAERKTKHYKGTGRTRTYVYYHCTGGKGGCIKQSMTQEQIETQVTDLLSRMTLRPKIAQWCLSPARRWHKQESGLSHDSLDNLFKALAAAERRKSNLFNERFTNPDSLTVEEFKEQKEQMQTEINALKKEIKRTEEKLQQVHQTVENVFDFAVNAKFNFENGNTKLRKEIAARLGINYYLTLGKLEIVPHPLLAPILTIEPEEKSSESNKNDDDYTPRPLWSATTNEILTLAMSLDISFPKIDWVCLT
jgi:DNA invertase Pin-like site-specific DNA recombinase